MSITVKTAAGTLRPLGGTGGDVVFFIDWHAISYVAVWTLVGILLISVGYRLLEALSPLHLRRQIEQGNAAAGIVAAGIFITVGILVGFLIRR